MSTYTALYRKWRPKVFEEVVGQGDLINAIKSQLKNGNVGHAYLFSGTRGTGKTSTAKIFSRAINCLSPVEGNPCNVCEICKGILDESLMDVVEIDAASNNGVDDIRELRENVKYPPSKAKYKVYIIDEVHMLSTGAFNALLKTLEEPPSYVVFILATTEPHKLPATILSRCQRFDFKRVSQEALLELLSYICQFNEVTWEKEALETIIKKSDGAARDSLSMLDQCLSVGEKDITKELVIKSLGLVQSEVIASLVNQVAEGDFLALFETVEQLIRDGKNINQFVKDMIDYYRDLMMVASAGPSPKVVKTSAAIETFEVQAKKLGLNRILHDLGQLIELDQQMKWSTNSRIMLEMTLVKLAQPLEAKALTQAAAMAAPIIPSVKTKPVSETRVGQEPKGSQESKTQTVAEAPIEMMVEAQEGDADGAVIQSKWQEIIQYLTRNKKASIRALLVEGTFVGAVGKTVQIGYPEIYGFHLNAIRKDENRVEVEKAILAVTGFSVRAQFDFLDAFQVKKDKSDEGESSLEALKIALGEYADKLEVIE